MHRAQGFKSKVHVEGQLYRIRQDGVVDAMASNFQRPNGLAFSEDEKLLYVTDTGFLTGYVGYASMITFRTSIWYSYWSLIFIWFLEMVA